MRRLVVLALLAVALAGCGQKEIMSSDLPPPKDPYAGMTPQQKIDAIRADLKIPDVERHTQIADAQKVAGVPVTGSNLNGQGHLAIKTVLSVMNHYDVAVIGGGPAGSTVGTLLKKYAPETRMLILERESFPRDHVGESQLPVVSTILHEMGA